MMIEEALFKHLKAHAGLSALVSSRIYPMVMPQKTSMPAVTFQRISTPREYTHGGYSGLAHPLFQISCWGEKYKDTRAVAEQVRLALQAYVGTMGGTGGVEVQASFQENEIDFYDPGANLYHVPVDFRIWHKEA